jgi:hypothetical protein
METWQGQKTQREGRTMFERDFTEAEIEILRAYDRGVTDSESMEFVEIMTLSPEDFDDLTEALQDSFSRPMGESFE